MSDEDDYETTEVQVKPKKERTPAQKAATARALEALALAREAKKTTAKSPTSRSPPAVKKAPTPVSREPVMRNTITYEEEAPAPVRRAVPKPEPLPDYGDDIRALSEGLHGVISYIEKKEHKKQKKKVAPPSESEDSSSEEEVVVKSKRKAKPMKSAPTPNAYNLNNVDPQDVLRSIFFRNH